MRNSLYVVIPLALILTVVQSTLLARLPVFDVTLQPALLIAIVWSLLRGPYEGLVWAFIAGFALDLFSIGPTGGMALALMIAVLPLTTINQVLPENAYLIPILLTALGLILFLLSYTLILVVTQRGFRVNVLQDLPATVILNTLLSIPIYWSLRWLSHMLYPRQIEM
ncbi:MAG TPA: rod shape-determining protein MreD [Candidatus Binatia bacterium]|jgi:rod shape-determining protein MreD|nr:rod shape-determining protein MreD [Candidatus Binatia bacterium]